MTDKPTTETPVPEASVPEAVPQNETPSEAAPTSLPSVKTPRAPIMSGGTLAPIIPRSLNEVARLAEIVVGSGLAPSGMKTDRQVAIAIMHGMELGLPPMQALQSIAVINGRPSIYGDASIALIYKSGLLESFKEWFTGEPFKDDYTAHCEVRRKDDPEPGIGSYSVADAKLAGLWGKTGASGKPTPWVTHPKRMLVWRARTAFRDKFPDVLRGLRFVEEVRDDEPVADIDEPPARGSVVTRLPGRANAPDVEGAINGNHEVADDAEFTEGEDGGNGSGGAGAGKDSTDGTGSGEERRTEPGRAEADDAQPETPQADVAATTDKATEAAKAAVPTKASLTAADKRLVADIQGAIGETGTPMELQVVRSEFAASIEHASDGAKAIIARLFEVAEGVQAGGETKTAKPKKSAAASKL